MTLGATRNAISSPEAGSGPSQPDWLDGRTIDLFGPAPVPASRSRRPAKGSEPMIQGICGRTFIGSFVPAGPLMSWESRLRARLAAIGSTESALIWKLADMPDGRSISRLAPSTRHTNGTGSTGSQWSTPRASDGEKGGPNMSFGAGGQPLPAQMHQAMLVTASSRDWKDTPGMATEAGDRKRIDKLPRQMTQMPQAMWPTACVPNGGRQGKANLTGKHADGSKAQIDLQNVMRASETAAPGLTPSGLPATTAKRGAPNPGFAFWLMGFPDEWICGALAAMPLYLSSRRKLSARSSTRKKS